MTLFVLLVVLFLTFFVYRQTRSYLWALGTFLIGMFIVPGIIDQVEKLLKFDSGTPTNSQVASSSPSGARRATAASCSCN